jgi:hypothetical protein
MSETQVSTENQSIDTDDLDAFASDFFGEKKEAAPAAKQEAEQDNDDEAGEVAAEAQKDEVDPNEDADAEFKEAPKKKQTVQDRIDEVVRQREEQRREFEAKLTALEAKLAEKAPTATVKTGGEPLPTDLNEDGTPKYELGEFDVQYIKDLTKFAVAQENAETAKRAEQAAKQTQETAARAELATDWNTRVETAKETYPDFNEKGQQLLDGFGSLDQGYAQYLATTLMSMPHGTDVLYYLSNNPTEAKDIVNSGALKATLALGRISAKFADADAQKQLAKPKVSNAPPPPPVRARGTNGAFVAVAPDTDDLDAFSGEFFRKAK